MNTDSRPEIVKVKDVDGNGVISETAKDSFIVGAGYYWWSGDNGLHYSEDLKSIEFAQGFNGVTQVYLAE